MTEGLFWLVLLGFFMILAWLGWREYSQIEAYRLWAGQFDHAKYDIYAVLGQKGQKLTWGKPTRKGPIDLRSLLLENVQNIYLNVDGQRVDLQALPQRGRSIAIELAVDSESALPQLALIQIPFTEISLAARWVEHLRQDLSAGQVSLPSDARS